MSYYIADLRDMLKPKVFPDIFDTVESAQDVLEDSFGLNYHNFDVITEEEQIEHSLPFSEKPLVRVLEYDYPPSKVTPQQRKTYRTNQRKKLRNSGGLYKLYVVKYRGQKAYTIKEASEEIPMDTTRCFAMTRTPDLIYCMVEVAPQPVDSKLIWQVVGCMVYNRRTFKLYHKNVFFYVEDSFYEVTIKYYYENLRVGFSKAQDKTNYKLFGLS